MLAEEDSPVKVMSCPSESNVHRIIIDNALLVEFISGGKNEW